MHLFMLSWWIILAPVDQGIPSAMGPYPTLTSCKVAGHYTVPHDERFMDPTQLAAAHAAKVKAREKAEADNIAKQQTIAEFLKAHPKGGTIDGESCNAHTVDATGKVTSSYVCATISAQSYQLWRSALTGCFADNDEEP